MGDHGEVMCVNTFLKRVDNDLRNAIDELCMGGIKPGRNSTGLTFFMPTGEFRDKFIALALSDPDDASKILNACIFDEFYPTLADLHKAGHIVNRLSQKVEVKTAGNTATLGNGSKVTKNATFKAAPSRSNFVVYNLEGPMPTNGQVVESTAVKRFTKKGGAELSKNRYVFAKRVEEDYVYYRTDNGLKSCPFTNAVGNLMAYLKHCCDDKSAYENAVRLLDYNTIASFYILFEPYNTSSNKVLSDAHFDEFIKKGLCPNPAKMIIDCIGACDNKINNEFMKELKDTVDQAMVTGPGKLIKKVYGDDKKRQAQDEFRDFVDQSMTELETFDMLEYRNFIKEVSVLTSNFSDIKFTVDQFRYIIKPGTEYYSSSYRFIRTTYFNYMPLTHTQLEGLKGSGSPEYGQYNDTKLVLRGLYHYEKLKDMYSSGEEEYESLKSKIECYNRC